MIVENYGYLDISSKILIAVISGFVAAYFSAKLALSRFYKEKKWERKQDAYRDLIDVLLDLKDIYINASNHYESVYRAEQRLEFIENHNFDWADFSVLREKLKRAYILSSISLNAETKNLIQGLLSGDAEARRMVYEESYPEQAAYSDMAKDVENLIELVVRIAKKELNL